MALSSAPRMVDLLTVVLVFLHGRVRATVAAAAVSACHSRTKRA